jgi:hypothetical protein
MTSYVVNQQSLQAVRTTHAGVRRAVASVVGVVEGLRHLLAVAAPNSERSSVPLTASMHSALGERLSARSQSFRFTPDTDF